LGRAALLRPFPRQAI